MPRKVRDQKIIIIASSIRIASKIFDRCQFFTDRDEKKVSNEKRLGKGQQQQGGRPEDHERTFTTQNEQTCGVQYFA